MSSTNPDNLPTRTEVEQLNKLEAIVQRGLDTDLELGNALAEISDASLYRGTHQTFEAYLRDRWDIRRSPDDQLSLAAGIPGPPSNDLELPAPGSEPEPRGVAPVRGGGRDALANVWEQIRHAFTHDGVSAVDLRITIHRREQAAELKAEPPLTVGPPRDLEADELLERLGCLLTQASGKIADVAHQLETRAADLDGDAREQLRDDLLALHDELAPLKALLEPVDWDAEHGRLLAGEIPPFQNDAEDKQDQ
jgi:hypothetical protein